MPSPFLSKSKYLNGLQCSKLLWYYYNAKSEIPPVDAATQGVFDQGHVVGEFAKKLYPDGIEVAAGTIEFAEVVKQSQALLREGRPLFEAAFLFRNAYARADILVPVVKKHVNGPPPEACGGDNDDAWDIIEVKSSTSVKQVNLHDLSLQWYTYSGAGLSLRKCFIMHINNKYVRAGEIDPKRLFTKVDVTDEVMELLPAVEENLARMETVIAKKKAPEVPIGPHCSAPYACPMTEVCWKHLPEHNPTTLNGIRTAKAFALIEQGVTDLRTLPSAVELTAKQQIQVRSIVTKKPHIDTAAIRVFLKTLVYPLYYLDFETFNPAVPLFEGSKPFQQIPFQFSLHVQDEPGGTVRHISYLHDGTDDPRPAFMARLKESLGTSGSIVTYNASYEKGRLTETAAFLPEYEEWNAKIQQRIVDLLDPFKAFAYYHPDQQGSASIKSVLPAVTGKGYEALEIAAGGVASQEYLRVTFGSGIAEQERQQVRENLEKYCALDTFAMVELVGRLREIAGV